MRRRALLVAGFVAVACAPLACRKRRLARYPGSAPPGGPGLRFLYELRPDREPEPGDSYKAMVDRTVEVLSRRVASLTDGGVVRPSAVGSGIEVFLPQGPAAMYEAFRQVARLPARFQVRRVDDGSTFMIELAKRVGADRSAGVEVQEDQWTQGGAHHSDLYLHASDRQRLVDVLTKDAVGNPLPPDREILLEKYSASDGDSTRWRSYYVEKGSAVDNSGIADTAVRSGYDGRPQLEIVLTPAGQRQFAELTTHSVGHKIAVVVDGRIETAPVVLEPIGTGHVYISTGANPSRDPAAIREGLEDLALALRSGPLPAPLMLLIEEQAQRIPEPTPR